MPSTKFRLKEQHFLATGNHIAALENEKAQLQRAPDRLKEVEKELAELQADQDAQRESLKADLRTMAANGEYHRSAVLSSDEHPAPPKESK